MVRGGVVDIPGSHSPCLEGSLFARFLYVDLPYVPGFDMDLPTQCPQEPYESSTITTPILRMQKLRHKNISYLSQGYLASKLDTEFESRQSVYSLHRS